MRSKIIIYGYESLGSKITKLLVEKDYEIIIVDPDISNYRRALEHGYKSYNYDLMEDSQLIELGIDSEVDTIFCLSKSENNNLFVVLSCRNLNKELKIIALSSDKQNAKKMTLAGASKILNPYEVGALRIFRLLHRPLILEVLDNILFNKTDLIVIEILIENNSILNEKYVNEIDFSRRYNLVLVGIMDKELSEKFIFNSSGINHKIDEGDTLVLIGYKNDLELFKKITQDIRK
ncbi:MAG: hypothetical protein C0625_03925 [Arcobacter sp.]|nr:MAG: hypothetical protein C0625_03925 [Arcobacter sp.]